MNRSNQVNAFQFISMKVPTVTSELKRLKVVK